MYLLLNILDQVLMFGSRVILNIQLKYTTIYIMSDNFPKEFYFKTDGISPSSVCSKMHPIRLGTETTVPDIMLRNFISLFAL